MLDTFYDCQILDLFDCEMMQIVNLCILLFLLPRNQERRDPKYFRTAHKFALDEEFA